MTETLEREMELTLPMVADIEIAAARAAGNLARELGMESDKIDEMTHAIIEACINAKEHACCDDQRIYLRFHGTASPDDPTKVEVWITDHGKGFDLSAVKSRSLHRAAAQKRGWGLQIMEAHMDQVEILSGDEGTTVHMIKYGEQSK